MIYKNGERMRDFLGLFVFIVVYFSVFWGVFNKTIIPLALVGYEMIIANSTRRYAPGWLSIISYLTRAHGVIVKCNRAVFS